MENVKRNVSGAMTYWTLGDTDLAKLRATFDPMGKGDLIPTREGVIVMREAIGEIFSKKDYLVRRTKSHTKLEIVHETRGDGANDYAHSLLVDTENLASCPPNLLDAYRKRQQVLPAEQVAWILTRVVAQLGGITLRDSGGFYWLPPNSLDTFKQIVVGIEGAALRKNKVYFVTTELDVETICSLKDSLQAEISKEAQTIMDELSGGMRKDAIENRRKKAQGLMTKIHQYEGLLSSSLDELRKSVEDIEVAASAAELAASQQKELVNA